MELSRIKQALKNNDEAFVELIQEKQLKLTKIAYRYCMNETMAQDALSETIYKAYRYRKKCKQPEYFDTWITRILINECYNEIKKNRYDELTIDINDPKHQDLALRSMVYDLDEPERTIIVLHFFEGYTLKEISEILEMSLNTVKTKYYRLLDKLKIELKGEEYGI